MKTPTLSPDLLHKIDAYWRAANYLSVGQIYLYDNPMLRDPLTLAHVKPLVVGHWGTVPLVRVTAVRRLSGTSISRAPGARSIRRSRRTKRG